jgi:hypothetical protein
MSLKCKLFGHDYKTYRYSWIEFLPTQNRPSINRDGIYTLTHVYCKRCGVIKEIVVNDGSVRYSSIK